MMSVRKSGLFTLAVGVVLLFINALSFDFLSLANAAILHFVLFLVSWIAIIFGLINFVFGDNGAKYLVLTLLFLTLLIVDIIIPDPLPLVDELVLGLGTMIFAGLTVKKI